MGCANIILVLDMQLGIKRVCMEGCWFRIINLEGRVRTERNKHADTRDRTRVGRLQIQCANHNTKSSRAIGMVSLAALRPHCYMLYINGTIK